MNIKRRLPLFLVVLLISTAISWAGNDDELKKKERELEELKQQIEAMDASIDANEALQNKTASNIKTVSTSIKNLEKEIEDLDLSIGKTENDIEVKAVELSDAETQIGESNALLNDRLRVMYKTGTIGYFEVLLGSENFTDLLSRVDMIQKILAHDQNLILLLKEQRDLINQKKLELESYKVELVSLVNSKQNKQTELEKELKSLMAYKEQLQKDQASLEELEDELLGEADKLTSVIKNLQLSETYVGGEMMWPVPGNYTITSLFGNRLHPITKVYQMHTGIDISCPRNSKVVAAQAGTVIYSGWYGGYGKVIILDHGGGYSTLYGHNDGLVVKVGQTVNKGDQIANSGSTGYSTGPHCHFEVRINGDYVDPEKYVKGN